MTSYQGSEDSTCFPLSFEQSTVVSPFRLQTWSSRVALALPGHSSTDIAEAFRVVTLRQTALRLQLVRADTGLPRQRVLPEDAFAHIPVESASGPGEAGFWNAEPPDVYDKTVNVAIVETPETNFLALAPHHVAWDRFSRSLLQRDMTAALALHTAAGPAPALPRLGSDFRSHVLRQLAAGDGLSSPQRTYWRSVVAEAPRRPPATTIEEAVPAHTQWMDVGLSSQVSDLARRARCTPASVVSTCFVKAAHDVLGPIADFVYAVHHGRDAPGDDSVIGFFARPVPVLVRFDDAPFDLGQASRAFLMNAAEAVRITGPPFSLTRLAAELSAMPEFEYDTIPLPLITVDIQAGVRRPRISGEHEVPGHVPMPRLNRLWLMCDIGERISLRAVYDANSFSPADVDDILRGAVRILDAG